MTAGSPPVGEQADSLADLPSSPLFSTSPLTTPSDPSTPTQQQPAVRGRPRSSSISSGSPAPPPGSTIPLPILFQNASPPPPSSPYSNSWPHRNGAPGLARVGMTSQPIASGSGSGISAGWGHKASLSVPGIVAPIPQSTGPGKVGRHRRTQSVSPPGFQMDDLVNSRPGGASGSTREEVKSSPIPIPASRPLGPAFSGTSRSLQDKSASPSSFSFGSSSSSSSPTGSPQAHHSHSHSHSHSHHSHGSGSHAALLSGIRSHALPHSPTLDAYDAAHRRPHSPVLATSPQSPPFGPTSSPHHTPSPLSLRDNSARSEEESDPLSTSSAPSSLGLGVGMLVDPPPFSGALNPSISRSISPPLLPLPPPVSKAVSPPTVAGRNRSGSLGHLSPPSPVSLFLEKDDRAQAQVDMRRNPEERHRSSPPPPEQIAFARSLPPPEAVAKGVDEPYPSTSRDILPPPALVTAPVESPPSVPPPMSPSNFPPLPPSPLVSDSHFSVPDHVLADDDLSFVPPASPHRSPISLPLPVVAPAPLPPHLGGPPLHSHPARGGSSSKSRSHSHSRLSKHGTGGGTVPKRHSPLASPALSNDSETGEEEREEDEEMDTPTEIGNDGQDPEAVARALEDAGSTEMDREIVPVPAHFASPLSPLGNDEHHEIATFSDTAIDPPQPPPPSASELPLTSGFPARPLLRQGSVSPPPLPVTETEKPQFGALGFMDIDPSSAASGSFEAGKAASATGSDVISIEESSLSPLERIFVCAKSDSLEDRTRVAHNLAEWLGAVDIAEAVEYVLPLLAGLATDFEDVVKEVFAPQLDRIMWHFFSQCPLLELEQEGPGEEVHAALSRYTAEDMPARPFDPPKDSPTSSLFVTDESSISSVPTTSKTSPSNTDDAGDGRAPPIPANTFTSLLGALLTDQSSVVALSTQSAVVRFICRIKGKAGPPVSPSEDPVEDFGFTLAAPLHNKPMEGEESLTPDIDEHSRVILEDEFLNGIVLGLARLDDDDDDDECRSDDEQREEPRGGREGRRRGTSSIRSTEDPPAPTFFMSPEEDLIDETWVGEGAERDDLDGNGVDPMTASWGAPLSTFAKDRTEPPSSENGGAADQIPSTFSADGQGEEESSIGKMVSMSLIAAIASADCLEAAVLAEQILPEVDRMKSEAMFYVRKEAVYALGNLAGYLPVEIFELSVLPLYATFAQDNLWHVRRAASVALPSICKRLTPALRRTTSIQHVKAFATDSSQQVRHGALETCGELIYLFNGDPDGVPDELLSFFLGQSLADQPPPSTPFAPLANALDSSPPRTFFDESSPWTTQPPTSTLSKARDPDRLVMCAFNFPAVALTLGASKWSTLRAFYTSLTNDQGDKVRQSLAASMHEIAKIVGPFYADESLLQPLSWYLRDHDAIQGAILENFSILLTHFTPEGSRRALEVAYEAWGEMKPWRRREQLVGNVAPLANHFVSLGATEELLRLVARAFKDPVAAVRERAVQVVPTLLTATAASGHARSQLFAFLSVFGSDSAARNRTTFLASVATLAQHDIDRSTFESNMLDSLQRLARDRVVSVRIGVAKAVAAACKSLSLYADLDARSVIGDLLHQLVSSSDREVAAPVLPFYAGPPRIASNSPPPSGMDRSGARSRMEMYSDEAETTAVRKAQPADPFDHEMSDVPLGDDKPSAQRMESGDTLMMGEGEGEGGEADGDVEMEEAEEGEFVEISRSS